jgi:hypothetical protein
MDFVFIGDKLNVIIKIMEDLSVSSPEIISGTIESPYISEPPDFPSTDTRIRPSPNKNTHNMTYNVQDDLRKFRLKRYMTQRGTVLAKTESGATAEEGDPLIANDIDGSNVISRQDRHEEPDPERYYKEVRRVININSRFRSRIQWIPVGIEWLQQTFPDLCREHWSETTNYFADPQKFTNCLNKLVKCGSGICDSGSDFLCKQNLVCRSVPLSDSPSEYRFPLDTILNNVKSLTLLSTEIPNTLATITSDNNVMTVDLIECNARCHDKCPTCTHVGYCDSYLLPYIVIQIPPGHYTLIELAKTIEEQLNSSVEKFTKQGYKDLFQVLADPETDAFLIQIKCSAASENVKFNVAFLPHPRVPELSLHYMLGFQQSSSNGFCRAWSNLVAHVSSNNCHLSGINKKPFRPIDLTPHKYIYLAIEGFKTIDDPMITGYDLFAKIQIEPSDTRPRILFNTYLDNPKFFVDSPLRIVENLKVSWIDAFGQLVDFQNVEQSFTLEFLIYVDYLVDSNFSSLRGTRDQTSFTQNSMR